MAESYDDSFIFIFFLIYFVTITAVGIDNANSNMLVLFC